MDLTLLWIAAIFLPAGLVKGVIGLGLPTIGMGLLALLIAPPEAAAVLALPMSGRCSPANSSARSSAACGP